MTCLFCSELLPLWYAIFLFLRPFYFFCSILTRLSKIIPKVHGFYFLFFSITMRFEERTPAIWRLKGWNHPDSCPATEPLKLPDKAVRLHFGSNCQSKLALPFTINKRQHKVTLQPMSKTTNCSPFHKH